MSELLVGIDIGGTKSHLHAQTRAGEIRADEVRPTTAWRGRPWEHKADQIHSWIRSALPGEAVTAMAVGAHGCDSQQQCDALRDALAAVSDFPVQVVNDAQLLGPAVGRESFIGVIAGTGSIAVGTTADGVPEFVGGWGWLLGDEGGASGVVREAVRALLRARDEGLEDGPFGEAMAAIAQVDGLASVPGAMMTRPAAEWSAWAPAVFEAAATGSPVARDVLVAAAQSLTDLVQVLVNRGVRANAVVLGGGVIARQPEFAAMVADRIRERFRGQTEPLEVLRLTDDPVSGAIQLARQMTLTPARPKPA